MDKSLRNVVFSINPEYVSKIVSGDKTVELRKNIPNSLSKGSHIIIYETSPRKHIVATAKVQDIQEMQIDSLWKACGKHSCTTKEFFYKYFEKCNHGYGIVLGEVRKLKSPLALDFLRKELCFTAPQSFAYSNPELESLVQSSL